MILTHTISLVEIIWTFICTLGLFFNFRVLMRASGDLQFVKTQKINSIREYAALTTMSMFVALVVVQLVFVIDGCLAMTLPSPGGKPQPLSYIITASFVLCSCILALLGFIQDTRRRYIITMIEENESD